MLAFNRRYGERAGEIWGPAAERCGGPRTEAGRAEGAAEKQGTSFLRPLHPVSLYFGFGLSPSRALLRMGLAGRGEGAAGD